MKTLQVDDSTYERLGDHAQPFETPGAVINRALDALDQQVDSPASTNSFGTDSERRLDPLRLPDMMFTKVLDATIRGKVVARPNWNSLLKRIVRLAKEHAKNFDELTLLCPINMVSGRKVDEGYRYLSDINVSVQSQAANSACLTIVTIAQKLNIALDIGFMWRNREDAAHPGDRARIQTADSLEDRTVVPAEKFKKPAPPPEKILFLKGPSGITASGYKNERGFIVRSGSKAAKNEAPSIRETTSNERKKLLKQGVFKDEVDRYRLVQDHCFNSPSAASSTLLGRSSNGLTEWKDAEGRSLKKIQEEPPEGREWQGETG